jgi:hypothetical protein
MKFGMGVVPMGQRKNVTVQFTTIGNTSMAGEETCEVGSTLASLAIGPYNDVR